MAFVVKFRPESAYGRDGAKKSLSVVPADNQCRTTAFFLSFLNFYFAAGKEGVWMAEIVK